MYVACLLRLGVVCCVVMRGVWGAVTLVPSVMRAVGGVPTWVECVFHRADTVCLCLVLSAACLCLCLTPVVTI